MKDVLNGVDVEKLRKTIDQVEVDPEKGHYLHQVQTRWNGGAHSTSTIRQFTVESDEPEEILGSDQAPNAVELVLSALGGCLCVGVAYLAALWGIEIQSRRFEIEGQLDVRGFFGLTGAHPGYERIQVMVYVQSNTERKKLESLLEQVIQTSPVQDIITRNVLVQIQLANDTPAT